MSDSTEMVRQLFEQYADAIYRYAKYSVPPAIDAKDVVQEVFVRVLQSWAEFKGKSEPKTWLFRIARNYIYDLLRRKRREQAYGPKIRMEQQVTQLDSTIEIEEALQKINFSYRQVLNLRLIQDMSVSETAQVLGWSESKVRVTLYRAKKRLRDVLEPFDDEVWDIQSNGGDTAHEK